MLFVSFFMILVKGHLPLNGWQWVLIFFFNQYLRDILEYSLKDVLKNYTNNITQFIITISTCDLVNSSDFNFCIHIGFDLI